MTAADARAWMIITLLMLLTFRASLTYAATGVGFGRLLFLTALTALVVWAWARRRHLLEAVNHGHR